MSFVRASGAEVAILGAGLMGRWHAATVRKLGSRVVAVVDTDLGRARTLASRFDAAAFASTQAMLDRVRPKAAHICTPLGTHVASSEQLLDAGCHVLCEKPLAADAANVERLLERAAAARRVLCPVHQFALQRGVRNLVGRLEELGAIRRIAFTFCSAGGVHLPPEELDNIVLDMIPHAFSVLSRIFPGTQLADISWQTLRPAAGELQAIGVLGETSISMSFSMSARPTEASATFAGTRGTAYIDFFHGFATVMAGSVSRLRKATRPMTLAAGNFAAAVLNLADRGLRAEFAYPGLRRLFSEFYASIDAGSEPPFSAAEILGIYRARDRLALQMYPEPHAARGT